MRKRSAVGAPERPGSPGKPQAPRSVRIGLLLGALLIVLWTLRAATSWGSDAVDRVFTVEVFQVLYVPSILVCATRAVRVRDERSAWVLLSLALIANAGGFAAYSLFVEGLASPPSPSIADASWLAYYPLAFGGLIMLVRRRVGSADRALVLDGLIGALALAAVAALLAPIVKATGGSGAAVATDLAYPLGDLYMAALVVTVFIFTRWRPGPAWLLLGLGFLVAAVGDCVYLYEGSSGTYESGTALDAVWPTMALLIGASAWAPAPRPEPVPQASLTALIAPLTFSAVALGLLVYGHFGALGDVPTGLAVATLVASQARTIETFITIRRLDLRTVREPLDALLGALAARDNYTGSHSETVVELATGVAGRLGLSGHEVVAVRQVGLLHDIGKIGIPDSILQKPGTLDAAEWKLMRQHPVVGAKIVAGTESLAHLASMVRAEHERWDGGGYPDGLEGEQIPLASRIIFACDAYHAMTSDRPYRRAMPVDQALQELEHNAGSQFDPAVVAALIAEMERGTIAAQPGTLPDVRPQLV